MNNPLRLNVGFLIHQSVGSSRDFLFELPALHLKPDLNLANLAGNAKITRTPQGLLTQVKAHASVQTECARCLTDFEQPLHTEFTELYAFSLRSTTDSELILPDDGFIDLSPLIREYLLLEIPINPLCRPDCFGICSVCGEPHGDQHHNHHQDTTDPRLAVLKTLLENEAQD
jgi:uncharacterized protein